MPGEMESPLTWNACKYVLGDPINHTDPFGLFVREAAGYATRHSPVRGAFVYKTLLDKKAGPGVGAEALFLFGSDLDKGVYGGVLGGVTLPTMPNTTGGVEAILSWSRRTGVQGDVEPIVLYGSGKSGAFVSTSEVGLFISTGKLLRFFDGFGIVLDPGRLSNYGDRRYWAGELP